MVNASSLPSLFLLSAWASPSQFTSDGTSYYLASVNGSWGKTQDPDGVRIGEAEFNAIATATPDANGRLVMGGEVKEVAARVMGDGYRWVIFVDPE